MTLRVFVSSTCFDLVDLRSELNDHLRDLSLLPVMSDEPTSDFELVASKDSIEKCLVNVRQADVLVLILSQRYGPSLQGAGFDDVSATHLEYRAATQANKRILFYVRDRTMAEYALWKSNKDAALKLKWVPQKDLGIFAFIAEHEKLQKDGADNWITTFRHSMDLKAFLTVHLGRESARARLRALREAGQLPYFHVSSDGTEAAGGGKVVRAKIRIEPRKRNISIVEAFAGNYPAQEKHRLGNLMAGNTESHLLETTFNPGDLCREIFSMRIMTDEGLVLRYFYDVRRPPEYTSFVVRPIGVEFVSDEGIPLLGPGERPE